MSDTFICDLFYNRAMNYSITYEPIDKIIIATVHGDASLGLMSKMLTDITDHMKETNSHRLINDMRDDHIVTGKQIGRAHV